MADLLEKCTVCLALVDEEDLFCANCGTEVSSRALDSSQQASQTTTHNFSCTGCGASMSFDASVGALRCPFCGSEQLDSQQDTRVLQPEQIVAFQIDQPTALQKMRAWLGHGFWRPSDLSAAAVVAKMTAVYVPYWVFQASTHTYWTADTSRTPAGARGDWFPLSGEHHGNYSGLLVGASGALTPAETSAICPFDLGQGVPPESLDLENMTVEQFAVQRKYARPLARQGLESLERKACQGQYVSGKCRNMKVNVRLQGLSSQPVLLPVWIMAYRYGDKLYRLLVNGQTGKVTGQAPISWKKILLAVAMAILGGFLLIILGLSLSNF